MISAAIEQLYAECLAQGTRETLPPTCEERGWSVSKMCRMAGGCPVCFAELLKGHHAHRQ